MEQPNLNNIITISGQITSGTIRYSEITISGRKRPSINYRLILNNKHSNNNKWYQNLINMKVTY